MPWACSAATAAYGGMPTTRIGSLPLRRSRAYAAIWSGVSSSVCTDVMPVRSATSHAASTASSTSSSDSGGIRR